MTSSEAIHLDKKRKNLIKSTKIYLQYDQKSNTQFHNPFDSSIAEKFHMDAVNIVDLILAT